MFGRDEHCKVGLAAGRGECRRNVLLFAVGEGNAQNEHMLCHPALVLAEEGGYSECKALLAEQHVAAVCRVYGNYRIFFGEVQDVPVFRLYVALCVEALHEFAAGAYCVEHLPAHARHYAHIQNYVDRVCNLDAVAGKVRTDYAHRIGYDVHRPAAHRAARNLVCKFVRLPGVHPIVVGACVVAVFGADKGSVFNARNVVHLGAVKVAVGQKRFVELYKLAGVNRLFSQLVNLFLAAVYPHDVIGLGKVGALFNEVENFSVFRKCHFKTPFTP